MRVAPHITLDDKERKILQRWSRGRSTPARLVLRAKIVSLAAKGNQNKDIASELGVERWFREITDKRIRRGTFHNVKQLQQAIRDYIAERNEEPKAFKWTAKADAILEKCDAHAPYWIRCKLSESLH